MEGLTEGRIVHYVLPNGEHRPAIVVRVWRDQSGVCEGYANLQVFTDGGNDAPAFSSDWDKGAAAEGIMWKTSVCYDENKAPGTYHWIERA